MGNHNTRWSEALDVIPMLPTVVWKIELGIQLREAIGARVLAALAHQKAGPAAACAGPRAAGSPVTA